MQTCWVRAPTRDMQVKLLVKKTAPELQYHRGDEVRLSDSCPNIIIAHSTKYDRKPKEKKLGDSAVILSNKKFSIHLQPDRKNT